MVASRRVLVPRARLIARPDPFSDWPQALLAPFLYHPTTTRLIVYL